MPASFLSDTLSLSDQLLDWCGWLVFSSAYPQPCFLHTSDRCRSLQKPNGKSLTLRQQLRETSSVVGYKHLNLNTPRDSRDAVSLTFCLRKNLCLQ